MTVDHCGERQLSSAPDLGAPRDGASALWTLAVAMALVAVPTALALVLDDRMLGHFNVWTKPLKFQLALALQAATLAWGLGQLTPALRRLAMPRLLAYGWIAVAMSEAGFITLQGARGVASHFNRTTPWEAAGATLMAAGAGVLVLVALWVGFNQHRHPPSCSSPSRPRPGASSW